MKKIIELFIYFGLAYGMFGCLFMAAFPDDVNDIINMVVMPFLKKISILLLGGPVLHIMYMVTSFSDMNMPKSNKESYASPNPFWRPTSSFWLETDKEVIPPVKKITRSYVTVDLDKSDYLKFFAVVVVVYGTDQHEEYVKIIEKRPVFFATIVEAIADGKEWAKIKGLPFF